VRPCLSQKCWWDISKKRREKYERPKKEKQERWRHLWNYLAFSSSYFFSSSSSSFSFFAFNAVDFFLCYLISFCFFIHVLTVKRRRKWNRSNWFGLLSTDINYWLLIEETKESASMFLSFLFSLFFFESKDSWRKPHAVEFISTEIIN